MFWRMGATASAFPHLPTLYIVHFLLLTPPVYQKNDGGVEMMSMTTTTNDERGVSGQKQKQKTAGFGVVLSLPSQWLS